MERSSSRPYVPTLNISQSQPRPSTADPRTQRAPASAATDDPFNTNMTNSNATQNTMISSINEEGALLSSYSAAQPTPRLNTARSYDSQGAPLRSARTQYTADDDGFSASSRGVPASPSSPLQRAAMLLYKVRFPLMFGLAVYGGVPLHRACLRYAHYYTYREHDDVTLANKSDGRNDLRGISPSMVSMSATSKNSVEEKTTTTAVIASSSPPSILSAWADEANRQLISPVASTMGTFMRAIGIPTIGQLKQRQYERSVEEQRTAQRSGGGGGGGSDEDGNGGGDGSVSASSEEASIPSIPIAVIVPLVALIAMASARYILVKPDPRFRGGGGGGEGGAEPPAPAGGFNEYHFPPSDFAGGGGGYYSGGGAFDGNGNENGGGDDHYFSTEKQSLGGALNAMQNNNTINTKNNTNRSTNGAGNAHAGNRTEIAKPVSTTPQPSRSTETFSQPLIPTRVAAIERRIDWDDVKKEENGNDSLQPTNAVAKRQLDTSNANASMNGSVLESKMTAHISDQSVATVVNASNSSRSSTSALLDAVRRNARENKGSDGAASDLSLGPNTATSASSLVSSPPSSLMPSVTKIGGRSMTSVVVEEPVVILALAVPSSVEDVVGLLKEAHKHKVRRVVLPAVHNHFRFAEKGESGDLSALPAIIKVPEGVEVEEVINVRQYCIATRDIIASIAVHRGVVRGSPSAEDNASPDRSVNQSAASARASSFSRGSTRFTDLQWFNHPFNGIYVFDTVKVAEAGDYEDHSLIGGSASSDASTVNLTRNSIGGVSSEDALSWCDFHIFLEMSGGAADTLHALINLVLYHRAVKPPRRAAAAGEACIPSRYSPLKRAGSYDSVGRTAIMN